MRKKLMIAAIGFGLLTAACTIDIEPNADGSLSVESQITEVRLQRGIDTMIEDPDVENLDVTFHDGFIAVDGTGRDKNTGRVNDVTFKATLAVTDGHLDVDLYDATWNGDPMPAWIVEFWNQSLARELEREARKDPDSTLVRVEVTDDDITLEWHIETEASRS